MSADSDPPGHEKEPPAEERIPQPALRLSDEDVKRAKTVVFDPNTKKSGVAVSEVPHRAAGLRVFWILSGITAAALVATIILAFCTYPWPWAVESVLSGISDEKRFEAYQQLQQGWLERLSTIGQLLVFGTLVPLLGTVVGYVLGSKQEENGK